MNETLGQRPRRIITRICITVSFAILAAVVIFPAFRHHLIGGGLLTVACAVTGIVCGLVYLRSTRGAR